MQNDIVRQPVPPDDKAEIIDVQPPQQATEPQKVVDIVRPPEQQENEQKSEELSPDHESSETKPEAKAPPEVRKKSTKPISVIVSAVVVCSGLIGGTIYMGLQNSSNGSKVATQSETKQSDADDTAQEINTALEESNAFQDSGQDLSADLSDALLGL